TIAARVTRSLPGRQRAAQRREADPPYMTLCVRSAGPRRVCGDLRFFIGGDPRPFTTVAAKPAGPRKPGVVESAAEARALVNRIGPAASFYKVGMELYAAAGMDFVRELLSL